ncbi:signal peptidase I [Vallitalea okinawensis]|uniref:signal peptidase I n=1 Tax=Vallitalea okinawensis TaxID=2078660 RepID=UPI000CFBF783|nr:signal peptidase I [Vallitalea okinawensis]
MDIKKAFSYILLCMVIVLLAAMLLCICISSYFINGKGNELNYILGVSLINVTTGGMEPVIHQGDLIIINNRHINKVDIGDIVIYRPNEDELVTHRIVSKKIVDGKIIFQLQGDANNFPDLEWVPQEDILGIYQLRLHKLAYIIEYLRSPLLLITILALLVSNRVSILLKKKIYVIRIKYKNIKK